MGEAGQECDEYDDRGADHVGQWLRADQLNAQVVAVETNDKPGDRFAHDNGEVQELASRGDVWRGASDTRLRGAAAEVIRGGCAHLAVDALAGETRTSGVSRRAPFALARR